MNFTRRDLMESLNGASVAFAILSLIACPCVYGIEIGCRSDDRDPYVFTRPAERAIVQADGTPGVQDLQTCVEAKPEREAEVRALYPRVLKYTLSGEEWQPEIPVRPNEPAPSAWLYVLGFSIVNALIASATRWSIIRSEPKPSKWPPPTRVSLEDPEVLAEAEREVEEVLNPHAEHKS